MNILSVQSHVAYGTVGNRAAGFALQRLGCEVWAVETLQFSNHPGYGAWAGEVFAGAQVAAVIDGVLERAGPAACDGLLSGYLGTAETGAAVLAAAEAVRAANPAAVYLCDPVIGDEGRGVYVRPAVADFLRESALPAADIVTPNAFELGWLTGQRIASRGDALAAARALIARGPQLVVVTSLAPMAGSATIEMLAVGAAEAWRVAVPRLDFPVAPNGGGDLVAALFLAHYLKTEDPAASLAESAAATHAVFRATAAAGTRELALVAAQDELVSPTQRFPVAALG